MVTNDDNSLAARRHLMTRLMQETIATLCKNMLTFDAELCVEGLLGITLDKTDVILLNIKQVISMANMQTHRSDEANNSASHNETGCEDHGQDLTPEIPLFGEVQSRIRHIDNSGYKEHSTENSCAMFRYKDASIKDMLHVDETDPVSDSKRSDCKRMKESDKVNDPKSIQSEDCDALETESCSELLTRTRKWKEKLDYLNAECTIQPWNNVQIKQEHLDDLAEASGELPGYTLQGTDSFDPNNQAHNFQPSHERLSTRKFKRSHFLSSLPSDFNNSSLEDPLNSLYSLDADNQSDLEFRCAICVMTFSTRHHLKRHNDTIHSQSPQLSYCPICKKAFRRRDTMQRHCKSIHSREMDFDELNMMQFTSIGID